MSIGKFVDNDFEFLVIFINSFILFAGWFIGFYLLQTDNDKPDKT